MPITVPIPAAFICPNTNMIMVEPVITENGHTYEKETVTPPFFPNKAIKDQIEKWVADNRVQLEQDLLASAVAGDEANVNVLLRLGIDANTKNKDNWTGLHLAAFHNHPTLISVFMRYGLSIDDSSAVLNVLPDVVAKKFFAEKVTELATQKQELMRQQGVLSALGKVREYDALVNLNRDHDDVLNEQIKDLNDQIQQETIRIQPELAKIRVEITAYEAQLSALPGQIASQRKLAEDYYERYYHSFGAAQPGCRSRDNYWEGGAVAARRWEELINKSNDLNRLYGQELPKKIKQCEVAIAQLQSNITHHQNTIQERQEAKKSKELSPCLESVRLSLATQLIAAGVITHTLFSLKSIELPIELLRAEVLKASQELDADIVAADLHAIQQKLAAFKKIVQQYSKALTITDGTPLMLAAYQGHVDVLKELQSAKASLGNTDSQQKTILHWAVSQGHLEFVRALLAYRVVDVNAEDAEGNTSLHLAVLFAATHVSDLSLIELLINNGASPDVENTQDQSVIDLAKALQRRDISNLLRCPKIAAVVPSNDVTPAAVPSSNATPAAPGSISAAPQAVLFPPQQPPAAQQPVSAVPLVSGA